MRAIILGLLAFILSGFPAYADSYANACEQALNVVGAADRVDFWTRCLATQSDLSPEKEAAAYNSRGIAYFETGDFDRAIGDYSKAIEKDPKNVKAYNNRGNAYAAKGDNEHALADFEKAVQVDPKFVAAYSGAVWILATAHEDRFRNGSKAIQLGEQAVKLSADMNTHDNLAAAYAEVGRFEDAVREEQRAIAMAEAGKKKLTVEESKKRLELYKKNQAFHQ